MSTSSWLGYDEDAGYRFEHTSEPSDAINRWRNMSRTNPKLRSASLPKVSLSKRGFVCGRGVRRMTRLVSEIKIEKPPPSLTCRGVCKEKVKVAEEDAEL